MTSLRTVRTGPSRPVRFLSGTGGGALALVLAAAVPAVPASAAPRAVSADQVSQFYADRESRSLWFGQPGRQADVLLEILETAQIDGLNPSKYRVPSLRRAVRAAASGKPAAVRRADMLLSEALVTYVRDLRRPANVGVMYVDPELRPAPPSARSILEAAARAPSLERYVAQMRWMHPLYGGLRYALMSGSYTAEQRDLIRVNLERARELPAGGRHVLVNAAAQRLSMYEDGEVVDSMRVVVGKPIYPTPMMAAFIRFAALNPYWFVPADLAAERIAPNVVKQGLKYLDRQGYQVVTDFVGEAKVWDPSDIDWQAVADGRQRVLIRQLPGPHNSMGRIKFMFPNAAGVYLHDNPERELFEEASRFYSGGCVRLEAAWRLSQWLFGRELTWKGAGTEEKVPLDKPVPVFITYLTAVPGGSQVAFLEDVYGRDKARLARIAGRTDLAAAR